MPARSGPPAVCAWRVPQGRRAANPAAGAPPDRIRILRQFRPFVLKRRTMLSALRSLFAFCLLVAACAGASSPRAGAQEQALDIHSYSLPFKIDEPAANRIGRLIW